MIGERERTAWLEHERCCRRHIHKGGVLDNEPRCAREAQVKERLAEIVAWIESLSPERKLALGMVAASLYESSSVNDAEALGAASAMRVPRVTQSESSEWSRLDRAADADQAPCHEPFRAGSAPCENAGAAYRALRLCVADAMLGVSASHFIAEDKVTSLLGGYDALRSINVGLDEASDPGDLFEVTRELARSWNGDPRHLVDAARGALSEVVV